MITGNSFTFIEMLLIELFFMLSYTSSGHGKMNIQLLSPGDQRYLTASWTLIKNLLIKKKILNYVYVAVKNQPGGTILSKVTSNIYFSFIHSVCFYSLCLSNSLSLFSESGRFNFGRFRTRRVSQTLVKGIQIQKAGIQFICQTTWNTVPV